GCEVGQMRSNEVDLRVVEPPFADAGSDFDSSRYVIFGVPYDATVAHRKGASGAPAIIREETYNFETYLMDLEVELEEIPICDIGDVVVNNIDVEQEKMLRDVHKISSFLLEEEKIPILMGGEHSITEASVNAFMEMYQKKGGIAVILDAHLDFRNEYLDNPHSHACVTRRLVERWGADSIFLIGVRSGCAEEVDEAKRMGLRYVTSRQVQALNITDIIDDWDSGFSIRDRPIYLSIDIDGIDPAYAPGTGTPEPWGMTSWDVLRIMEELYQNVRAMDVMEISPEIERYATPALAGKLIRQMIGLKEMKLKDPTWLEKV
ncbi:MAG: agmatinase, partial [Candidatus Thermoplasmatota archaeon]|nr:agmatinase [Candidatus Thermoplasmatota archaeon]